MPFEMEPRALGETAPPQDEMLLLGRMAARGHKPVTTKIKKKAPIPREARVAFAIALGLIACLLLLAVVRSHA